MLRNRFFTLYAGRDRLGDLFAALARTAGGSQAVTNPEIRITYRSDGSSFWWYSSTMVCVGVRRVAFELFL
jgi:hypothetical protein